MSDKKAFTLIELLMYVAIVAIVITFATLFTFELARSTSRELVHAQEQGELLFVIERISREIQASAGVMATASTFGTHPSRLSLATPSGGTDIIEFDAATSSVRILRSDGSSETLTSQTTKITSFIVWNRSEIKRPAVIAFEIASRHIASPLQTTVSLRSAIPML